MRNLAIIPARSGSKGIKNKNIYMLNGKPLIAYTIQAAVEAGIFDTVHVSTDSIEYADIAIKYGADVPFLRNKENSADSSSTWDVVREVLQNYQKIGKTFDNCIILQPTTPLRSTEDIRRAFEMYEKGVVSTLTSVSETPVPVQMCFRLGNDMKMTEYGKSPYKDCRRQELDDYYIENGAIYICRAQDISNPEFDFYNDDCIAYIMDKERSIDIDEMGDLIQVEYMIRMKDKGEKRNKVEKLILFGADKFGESVIDSLNEIDIKYDAIIIDGKYATGSDMNGIKVAGDLSVVDSLVQDGYKSAFVSTDNESDRNAYFSVIEKKNLSMINIIDKSALISRDVKLGTGIFIGKKAMINSGTTIGDGCIVDTDVIIGSDCVAGKKTVFSASAVILEGASIGKSCIIGAGTIIKAGALVPDKTQTKANEVIR